MNHHAKPATDPNAFYAWLQRIRLPCEILSYLALIAAAPIAVIELKGHGDEMRDTARKESRDRAERVYREVDDKFTEFMRLCLEHPELDCYSVAIPAVNASQLTEQQKVQQKLLYTVLTDVLEVAFVQYRKPSVGKDQSSVYDPDTRAFFDSQWPGWDAYAKKFMSRKAYRDVWAEIGDEYDEDFGKYMKTLVPPSVPTEVQRGGR